MAWREAIFDSVWILTGHEWSITYIKEWVWGWNESRSFYDMSASSITVLSPITCISRLSELPRNALKLRYLGRVVIFFCGRHRTSLVFFPNQICRGRDAHVATLEPMTKFPVDQWSYELSWYMYYVRLGRQLVFISVTHSSTKRLMSVVRYPTLTSLSTRNRKHVMISCIFNVKYIYASQCTC